MAKLSDLIPIRHNNVIAVVKQAGIDVTSWDFRQDGTEIDNPNVNQSKIYQWSFGGDAEPTLLFIWHDSLKIDANSVISYTNNLRAYKSELANVASGSDEGSRNTARLRHDRAHEFETAVQSLAKSQEPCKVALLIPYAQFTKDEVDTKSVKFRELDTAEWYVHYYDVHTGQFEIVRDIKPPIRIEAESQFDLIEPPEKYLTIHDPGYLRSLEIKEKVLIRSRGKCEFCGERGFLTHRNTIFLEVHHVVPLGKNGVDELWNVAAVCPKHHREAHFGMDRSEILNTLVSYLARLYPENYEKLRNLANAVVW